MNLNQKIEQLLMNGKWKFKTEEIAKAEKVLKKLNKDYTKYGNYLEILVKEE